MTLANQLDQDGAANVMRFVVARKAPDDSRIPAKLPDFRPLSPTEAVVERTFTFQRGGAERHGMSLWTVNGRAFSPDHIAATPRLGTTETDLTATDVGNPQTLVGLELLYDNLSSLTKA